MQWLYDVSEDVYDGGGDGLIELEELSLGDLDL